ncbi:Site-specific DNA recombinase [Salinibacillus kushneri]|uniref:Site-specific DNA recombinase n=1 Tax=Salinibacillus kushneri TaxID=237682 RepID=A0A1I0A697_9BACI|nr:recombinase family protein [Salinibacillus kushneri]SES89647.1 Site-specific DNA recombinase [Salinibacillus kushneri]
MKKAVGYIRVSDMGPKAKVNLKESQETQLSHIKNYCEQKGYELVEVYEDLDYSGGTSKRPAFQQMFNEIKHKDNDYDVIVVYSLSRFARNLKDLLVHIDIMEEHNVEFASATEEFLRTDNYMGTFMINILGAIAELQRMQIAETVRDNMIGIARSKGRFLGGIAPLGYNINPKTKKYEINNEEADVVETIFNMYLEGKGIDTITQHLIRERALGREKYSKSTIRSILVNPIYTGDLHYNRRKNIGEDRKKWNGEDQWIVNEDSHTPIISKKIFNEVQKLMKEKSNNNPFRNKHKGSKHLLSGILTCGNCGNHYFANAKLNGSGNKYEYYICSGKQRHSRAFCQAKGIRVDKIDPLLIDSMNHIINQDMLLKLFNKQFEEYTSSSKKKLSEKLNLERQKNKIQEQINRLVKKVIESDDKRLEEIYEENMIELKEKSEELQIEIENFDEDDMYNIESLEAFKKMLVKGDKFELTMDFVKMLDKELQRDIVSRFIDKVIVEELENGNSKLTVKYKIEMEDLQIVKKINKVKVKEDFDERREIFNKILNHVAHCGYDDYTGPPVSLDKNELILKIIKHSQMLIHQCL